MRLWPFFDRKSLASPTDDELALFTGTTPGTLVSADSALRVPAVAAAVRTISEAAASLDLHVVTQDDEPTRVKDHAALLLLRTQVNDWTSGFEFIRDLTAEALTLDKGGIAWVNRLEGKPVEIIHYKPSTITCDVLDTREPRYSFGTRSEPAANIIHMRSGLGRCPINLAREAIAVAIVMEAYAGRLFKNGARPGGVIESPKGLGETAFKRMKAGWRAAHEGEDNAGKTAFLFDGATFKQLTMTSVDAQFLEMRRFAVEEIARAFGMPVQMLGDLTKSSYANAEQKQKEFLSYCLDPWLCALEAAFNRALLSDDERGKLTFRFDRDDLSRADLQTRATAINSLISSETINPNEGRSWLGLAPYDGGDEFGNRNITVEPSKPQDKVPADA